MTLGMEYKLLINKYFIVQYYLFKVILNCFKYAQEQFNIRNSDIK